MAPVGAAAIVPLSSCLPKLIVELLTWPRTAKVQGGETVAVAVPVSWQPVRAPSGLSRASACVRRGTEQAGQACTQRGQGLWGAVGDGPVIQASIHV